MADVSSLQQIRPEPIEDIAEEDIPSFSPVVSISGSGVLPLSPSSSLYSILRVLIKVQKYSAYTFTSFVGIHLTSVVVVPLVPLVSADIKQEVFEMARAVYMSIPQFENIVILGSSIIHVASGVAIRIIRSILRHNREREKVQHRKSHVTTELITDDTRDDIGLGGITNLLGLGYTKSLVSQYLGMSPLSVAGYCLIPLISWHYAKFRYVPLSIDGDSSLVNLNYISYYLNISPQGTLGQFVNFWALASLLWVGTYHMVNGLMKLNHKFSKNWKRAGWTIVNSTAILGYVALVSYKRQSVETSGFIGRTFVKYLQSLYL
ncbi:hypothetical protein G9P44_000876 [Scheffersomyces stipitis]|nr:hypothetical protein G9P44_000876 [Scheffersomyces stipitis]